MTVNTACDQHSIRTASNDSSGVKKNNRAGGCKSYHGLEISCFLAHEQGLSFQGFAENGMIILYLGSPKLWLLTRCIPVQIPTRGHFYPRQYCLVM